jgi:hypothetical protein
MFTIPELTANALGSHLAERMRLRFGSTDPALIERVESAARLAIDCIGNVTRSITTLSIRCW